MAAKHSDRGPGVHSYLYSLGLRTYNPINNHTRAKFRYLPVIQLYRTEIPYLFGLLCHDGDTAKTLDRTDPKLFDEELDNILENYGPLIWPAPSEGVRDHLRSPQIGTLYSRNLFYPHDAAILKDGLRGLILSKRRKPETDIRALLDIKKGNASAPGPEAASHLASKTHTTHPAPRFDQEELHDNDIGTGEGSGSESEDSVIGVTTQRNALATTSSQTAYSNVKLRLYRKLTERRPGDDGPVLPYEAMFLARDCTTSDNCFNRICTHIQTDCNFMIFRLPEDMAFSGNLRIERGSGDGERTFQKVLESFRQARKLPGEPQYRSIEVEVGLGRSSVE